MYAKLVFRNAKRSLKDYLIYIVTMTICVMLFYAFLSISSSFYQPDIGVSYDFTLLSDGMKLAVCTVTLLLLFLIRYVNSYMLRSKQREFAIQSVMGMEQNTVGWLFFSETFIMDTLSIVLGIILGVLCSQFITAMLMTSYGQSYSFTWTLFPDTVLWTICFFTVSFFAVGMFNVRTIRKIKVIDMLAADAQNEPALKKSHYMPVITVGYLLLSLWMLETGIQKMVYFFDPRFALPVHILFWGNILSPALTLLWSLIWVLKKSVWSIRTLLSGLLLFTVPNICFAALVPAFQNQYYLPLGSGTINQYLLFLAVDFLFLICGVIYLSSSVIAAWKDKSPEHRYRGTSLFFFGQITSKLVTTTKTMTLICITLTAAIFLFLSEPVLTGWSSGYLDMRSKYDVQIFSRYNDVYEEENLPHGDYETITAFLTEHGIETEHDCTFYLYLPREHDFQNRVKYDFPVVAISLSDYNTIREMLGYERISLTENTFTTQWQSIASEEDRNDFLENHTRILTDAGELNLSKQAYYVEAIGESVYNTYTDVIYVFPDTVCEQLLPVMRNRYITTSEKISYENACKLEQAFSVEYPESTDTGVGYAIRLSTLQINSTKASNFVLQAAMIYGSVVLMVMCLTILSLQQLLDAGKYKYRFSLLRKLGVEEQDIKKLIRNQLGLWFGLPVTTAILLSAVMVFYFIQSVSNEISAYIGFDALISQASVTVIILILLLVCYFISTWLLFQKSIDE